MKVREVIVECMRYYDYYDILDFYFNYKNNDHKDCAEIDCPYTITGSCIDCDLPEGKHCPYEKNFLT